MINKLKDHWGKIALAIILCSIIVLNFRFGYFVLGNDNYSPELNPKLSLERSITNPAWRDYRVLGIPSDSEQADLFRSFIFYALSFFFPNWFISQLYIFFAFFIAPWSLAYFAYNFFEEGQSLFKKEIIFLFSGLLYFTNLLTSWIFFSPLRVFLATFSFLPFVLWRLTIFFQKPNRSNFIWLGVAAAFLSTSAIVATSYLVEVAIILLFIVFLTFINLRKHKGKKILHTLLLSIFILFVSQLFWILPFFQYVKYNSYALQESYINRTLTPQLIQNEIKYNTPSNILRFYSSWLDTRNDDGTYQFLYRNFYEESFRGKLLSFIPLGLTLLGIIYIVRKKYYSLLIFPFILLIGWFLTKGINPPFGIFFKFLQENIPLFKQVFRWQSSKLFPAIIIPLAFLGSLGIIFITDIIDSIFVTLNSYFRQILYLSVTILLICFSLLYIFPFFQGALIDKSNFVKIPQDYFNLSDYLNKNDKTSRIYIAPEANTLYFRSYTWGFFGSSFLNYLIPNPIVEKALTTGSLENEQAQRITENAYYSENPNQFIQALKNYKTPLVLLDRNVTRIHNGYHYNWEIAKKVIENNPEMEKIWQSGNLSLYKSKESNPTIQPSKEFYYDHNWEAVNILSNPQINGGNYYSIPYDSGIIYPFGLNFTSIDASTNEIITSSIYQGKDEIFSYAIDENNLGNNPSQIKYFKDSNRLIISPSLPFISINNQNFSPQIPQVISSPLRDNLKFISVGDEVVDLSELASYVSGIPWEQISQNLLQWEESPKQVILGNTYEEKYTLGLEKDSIVSFNFKLWAESEFPADICVFSTKQYKCVNRENTIYLKQNPVSFNLVLPSIIESGDTLEVYLTTKLKQNQQNIKVEEITASTYNVSSAINLIKTPAQISQQPILIPIKTGDTINLSIPKIYGNNSYHYDRANPFIPDATSGNCNGDSKSAFLKKQDVGPLDFNSKDCFDQSIIKMERITPAKVSLLFYEGKNTSGIPLMISFRNNKEESKIFEDRLLYESNTKKLSFFLLPPEIRSYLLELYSYGLGPVPSINNIENLSLEFIPDSWLNFRLIPQSGLIQKSVYTINQGFHPNWKRNDNNHNGIESVPVKVNGWEQGWILGEDKNPQVKFWPNELAFGGFAIFITGLLLLLIFLVARKVHWRNSSSRDHH